MESTVFVVDDEPVVRDSLSALIQSVGLRVQTFASAEQFLQSYDPAQPGCLVLDFRMPGMTGTTLQERMMNEGNAIPIIFISGHADVKIAVRAMKHGAVDFVLKPFSQAEMLTRIQESISKDRERRRRAADRDQILERMALLTAREQEVMEMVVEGNSNKNMAEKMRLSPKTIEVHRARVMRKMGASSLAELVRLVLECKPVAV